MWFRPVKRQVHERQPCRGTSRTVATREVHVREVQCFDAWLVARHIPCWFDVDGEPSPEAQDVSIFGYLDHVHYRLVIRRVEQQPFVTVLDYLRPGLHEWYLVFGHRRIFGNIHEHQIERIGHVQRVVVCSDSKQELVARVG